VKSSSLILRAVCAFVAFCVLQMIAGMLAGVLVPTKTAIDPQMLHRMFYWIFAGNAVIVAALLPLAVRTEWRAWKLGIVMAAIPAAIVFINGIEGMIFLKNSPINWSQIFVSALISAAFMIPVWTFLFGRRSGHLDEHFHPIASKSRAERAWKFVVCDFSYFALYIIAGTIIFPYIKDFYATQTIPSPGVLVGLQLLVRGPLFVVLCLLFTRMLGLPRLSGGFVVGLLFTLLSGVAPLLMPNPYFPDSVRWMHFMEVTSSNFVFGAIVAWLWGKPELSHAHALPHAA
jgi:hypothetical protein